jgi:hypothetical protein
MTRTHHITQVPTFSLEHFYFTMIASDQLNTSLLLIGASNITHECAGERPKNPEYARLGSHPADGKSSRKYGGLSAKLGSVLRPLCLAGRLLGSSQRRLSQCHRIPWPGFTYLQEAACSRSAVVTAICSQLSSVRRVFGIGYLRPNAPTGGEQIFARPIQTYVRRAFRSIRSAIRFCDPF